MKINYFKIFLMCLMCVVITTCTSNKISASALANFSVIANYNEHQNANVSYFDITVKPNESQKISVTIENTGDQGETFYINVNQANTNKNGIIDYTNSTKKLLNPPFYLEEILDYQHEIFVNAHGKKRVDININTPNVVFNGEVLGGIYVTSSSNQKINDQVDYAYVIGLRLHQKNTKIHRKLVFGHFELKEKKNESIINIPIYNYESISMKDLRFDISIKKNGKVLLEKKCTTKKQIAPNSEYEYSEKLSSISKFGPGVYEVCIQIKDNESNQWVHAQQIQISNHNIHFKKENLNIMYIFCSFITVVSLFIATNILLRRKRE